MKKYDYLIVGAGLSGSVCAFELSKAGKRVLVIDKRNHVGGNIYTKRVDGIDIHCYGAHIFHTNDEFVWNYLNEFAHFNNFVNSPLAIYKNEIYNLPFNMNTFSKLWPNVVTPLDALSTIEKEKATSHVENPKNLEEQAINLVGKTVYEKLIKGYTKKQWGRECNQLPPSIIKRLPVRFYYDNNYFVAKHQGIPIDGYTDIISKMLLNVDVLLNRDYFEDRNHYDSIADRIIFTGQIDKFFEYKFGRLEYRSLRFEHKKIEYGNYQGNAVINYTDEDVPYTRIIEHKFFNLNSFQENNVTHVTFEYPAEFKDSCEPFYPINDEKNNAIAIKYKELASELKNVFFIGRLGQYKYCDMDVAIKESYELSQKLLEE